MSVSSKIASALVATSVATASLAPLTTAAQAEPWGHRDGGHHERWSGGDGDWNDSGDRRFRGFQTYRHQYRDQYADHAREERRERRKDRKIARGVAIGLGVLMLGAILSQAGNARHYDRYDY